MDHRYQPLARRPGMLDFLIRLHTNHNLWMTSSALVIGGLGAYATSALGRQAATSHDRLSSARWLTLAIAALSFAIWSSAVLTVMGNRVESPWGIEPGPMVVSFAIAFFLVGLGAVTTLTGRFVAAPAFGGAIAGFAVPVAQFVGMSGFRVAGTIEWNAKALAASVVISTLAFVLSTVVWVRSRSRNPVFSIVLFALAIGGGHLLAMNAAQIRYDRGVVLQKSLIGNEGLAWIIGAIAIIIVSLTWTARVLSRQSRRRREVERAQIQQLAEVAVEGLVICNGQRIVWMNRSLEAMLRGVRSAFVGQALDSILSIPPLADVTAGREIDALLLLRRDDTTDEVPVRVITRPIVMTGRPQMVVAVRDQRDRIRAEAEMERLANSDALTELPNRARFNVVLHTMFSTPRNAQTVFALLALDLDRFKAVNDRSGHAAGDAVLSEVARRLVQLVRKGDLVARLGGDEFSIVATTGSDPTMVCALAQRIIDAIARPYMIDGRTHQIGVSIGIAFAGIDGSDAESLSRSADLALYRAKTEGRNTFRLFEDGMRVRMQQRHGLEHDMRQAIERSEFSLYYQPQIDAGTGDFVAAEALLRWASPTRGLVSPLEFVPVLEETGLILQVGAWVLRTACEEAIAWPSTHVVAVNVSPIQLKDPTLVEIVSTALRETGLPGERLELEITESILIEDVDRVRGTLDELKRLGIRLSLDDFGTGYSSLGQLHRFPFDRIKIDRSFVRGLPGDIASAAIVRAVVALGKGLGLQTTAEGVETEAQRRFVIDAGCDQIQGYLVGLPSPSASLPAAFSTGVPVVPADSETGLLLADIAG